MSFVFRIPPHHRLAKLHDELVGAHLDTDGWCARCVPPKLLPRLRATWLGRYRSELRSIQIFTRYLGELTAAGAPPETYAMAADAIRDEVRHTALCRKLVEALGLEASPEEPFELRDPPSFLALPMLERALATTVTMLAINETLSVAFLRDLRARCDDAVVGAVLEATLGDEEGHQDLGWEVLRFGLPLLSADALSRLRAMARATLEPHRLAIHRRLASVPTARRHLDDYPEPELARFGLFGEVRQALVAEGALTTRIEPRLLELRLL